MVQAPRDNMAKVLFTLNFLNIYGDASITPAEKHYGSLVKNKTEKINDINQPIYWKDVQNQCWKKRYNKIVGTRLCSCHYRPGYKRKSMDTC